jgi:integrase
MFTRTQRYVRGSLRRLPRKKGPSVWEWRYSDRSKPGSPLRAVRFSTSQFPSKTSVWKHIDSLLWKVNAETPQDISHELSFGGLCDRFITDERLRELDELKSGQQNTFGNMKVSTARSYLSIIENHLRPRWGALTVRSITASLVAEWFKQLPLASSTKAHHKALLYRLFEKAMLWEVVPVARNPMELVEIKGSTKRGKKPNVLDPNQCISLLQMLKQPHRTMVIVSLCLGLRISETLALQWEDLDFEKLTVRVSRAVVRGIVDRVKTEYSQDELPLDADFVAELLAWKKQCLPSADGWVFPSPATGRPFEPGNLQQKTIRKAGDKLGISNLGWHSFRHTYRAWLDAAGAPIGVQQKLMRHAQVSTTMNVYGNALMDAKREANSKAVAMLKGSSGGDAESNLVYFGVTGTSEAVANAV